MQGGVGSSPACCPALHARPRADQIVSVRTWLNESCGIPESDMVGMRNPFLITNPGIRKVGAVALLMGCCWCGREMCHSAADSAERTGPRRAA